MSNEISIKDLFGILWKGKFFISAATFLASFIAIIYSLNLPNIYSSNALIAPMRENQSANSLSAYSGLASLAGINLNGTSNKDTTYALETLRSLKFFEEILIEEINLEDLMAVKKWDRQNNKIIYDDKIFNVVEKKWVRKVSLPRFPKPSSQEAHKHFLGSFFGIYQDKDSGLITLTIRHQSPVLAKIWLDQIIVKINQALRQQSKNEVENAINFLNQQISKTSFTETRQALASVLQNEIEKLMLIEASEDYVFKTIDPAYIPEERSTPNRSLIIILGSFFGFLIGSLIIISRKFVSSIHRNS